MMNCFIKLRQNYQKHVGWVNDPAYIIRFTLGLLCSGSLHAESALAFKQDSINNVHWTPYVLVLGILIVALLVLAKKSKGLIKANPECQLIEKIPIHHKTKVYVIDYQGQRFLLADNQNSLAIHPLEEVKPSL